MQTKVTRSKNELMAIISTIAVAEQVDEKHNRIRRWIAPLDCTEKFDQLSRNRIKGPGERLVESDAFKDFVAQTDLEQRKKTLLYMDKPGTGKSVLTTFVIDKLRERFGQNDKTVVAYLFCEWDSPHKQTAQDLVGSLLSQLIHSGKRPFPVSLKRKYIDACKRSANPDRVPALSFDDLRRETESFVTTLRVFVVVDALDECAESSEFLKVMTALQAAHDIRLFATSRNVQTPSGILPSHILADVHAGEEDTAQFIGEKLSRMAERNRIFNPVLQDKIKEGLNAATGGMFQLAKVYLESWSGKIIEDQVLDALQRVVSGGNLTDDGAYNNAYGEYVRRITQQSEEEIELATLAFAWIACGTRPLTSVEFRDALRLHYKLRNPTQDALNNLQEKTLSVCCGLVEMHESTGVRLAHKTAQEYFERTQKSGQTWLQNAETILASTCLNSLLSSTPGHDWVWKICGVHRTFDWGKDGPPQAKGQTGQAIQNTAPELPSSMRSPETRLLWGRPLQLDLRAANKAGPPAQPPLIQYAQLNWCFHVRQAQQTQPSTRDLDDELLEFLRSEHFSRFEGYVEHIVEFQRRRGPARRAASSRRAISSTKTRIACDGISAVHLAAYLGFHDAVGKLTQDWRKDLVNQKTSSGITPLLCAIMGGHLKTVEVLIERLIEKHPDTTTGTLRPSAVPPLSLRINNRPPNFYQAHDCARWAHRVGLKYKLGPDSYRSIAVYLEGKLKESQENGGENRQDSREFTTRTHTFRRRPTR